MIEVRDAVKVLGGRPVLSGVSLSVRAGEFVALFGPNGSGKSTLLRLVAGLARPDRGQVRIDGVPSHQAPASLRRRVGLLAHQPYLYENLSGEENLLFWARIFGVAGARRRIDELLSRFGLILFADDPVRTYSRGMIQRLAVARVLLHDPEIVLLDEPFTGLDRPGVRLLTEVLGELKSRGCTLLVVSHRPDEVAGLADRVAVLAGGKVRGEVPISEGTAAGGREVARVAAAIDRLLGDARPGREGREGVPRDRSGVPEPAPGASGGA